jgi:ribosomal protein L11 methyltransferase
MPWLQIQLHTDEKNIEFVEELLTSAGAVAVTYQDAADQPVFEPAVGTTPLWGNICVIGLFDVNCNPEELFSHLAQNLDATTLATYRIERLEDQDWERSWMDNFHPMRFGQRLWVCPSWREIPEPDAVNILLDPGLAFGTGTHATTALCLEWLDAHPPIDQTVIDYGCGSGILAIAALKLGARQVLAIDNDPQALEATEQNAIRNHCEKQLITALPFAVELPAVDTLLANILAAPLIELEPLFKKLIKPHGHVVLSGLLESQVTEVRTCYQKDFEQISVQVLEGWARITGLRR